MVSTVYTETKNNKWLISQGRYNSGKLITSVIELKKKISKTTVKLHMTTMTMAEVKRRWKNYETLHEGQMVFQDRGFSGS